MSSKNKMVSFNNIKYFFRNNWIKISIILFIVIYLLQIKFSCLFYFLFWNKELGFVLWSSFIFLAITVLIPNYIKKRKKETFIIHLFYRIMAHLDNIKILCTDWNPKKLTPDDYQVKSRNCKKFTQIQALKIEIDNIEKNLCDLNEYKDFLPHGYLNIKQRFWKNIQMLLPAYPNDIEEIIMKPFENFFIEHYYFLKRNYIIHCIFKNKEYEKVIRKAKKLKLREEFLSIILASYIKLNQNKKASKFLKKYIKDKKIDIKGTQFLKVIANEIEKFGLKNKELKFIEDLKNEKKDIR